MAGSRLDKISNIFSRATGLLRTGAIRYEDRPTWYDVYRVFPPKYEPRYNREVDQDVEIKPIFYEEDLARAEFFAKYGRNPGGYVRDLKGVGVEDDCQRFISSYNEIKKANSDWTHSKIFEAATMTITSRSPRRGEVSEDVNQDETSETVRRRGRVKLITQDSLLEMFKESKDAGSDESNKPNKS